MHPRARLAVLGVALSLALVLVPSLSAAEPGFSPVRQMPSILGVPTTTLEAYASVSCPTRTSCTAVGPGFLINSQQFSPLAAPTAITATNGAWGPRTALPLPSNEVASTMTSAAVSTITCTAADDCTGVGSYPDGAGNLAPLVETEVAGTWTASSIVLPGGVAGTAELDSVWCASATSCVAFGVFQPPGQSSEPMVAVEASGSWAQAVALPDPGGAGSGLQPLSITCSGIGDCVAVAIGGQSVATTVAWSEHGGEWGNAVGLPRLAGWQFLGISIACPTTAECLLGGGLVPVSKASNQDMFPAVMTESSGTWSEPRRLPVPTLTPVTTQGLITSLACPTATTCEAVGGLISSSPGLKARPGAYTWHDGRWSSPGMIRGVPLGGAMAYLSYFSAVACSSATACMAIGPDRAGMSKHALASTFFSLLTPTRPAAAPSRPTSVVLHSTPHGAIVRWSPPIDDGGAPVSLYEVTLTPGGIACTTTRDGCLLRGLQPGRRYVATVTVSNVAGTSAPTAPISFVPEP